jgi:hypothetical protein
MFSQSLQNWGEEEWGHVIFSAESNFHLFGSDGVQYCHRYYGDSINQLFTQKTVKHGGGKVIVWECINKNGVGRLHSVDGIMDKH